jgi:hypothetical protein
MSREATMLQRRREVRLLRLSLVRPAAPNTYGGSPDYPCQSGPGAIQRSRPRNSTVPPVGRSRWQADLGERMGGVGTPVSRVAKLGVGSNGGPPSHHLLERRLGMPCHPRRRSTRAKKIPAYRTAGQSKRARSGVSRTPLRNAGDARKHHRIAPSGAFQSLRFFAASLVAFVPGVPQLGLPARPYGAGLAQGGGLRGTRATRHGTGTCSCVHSSRAPS